MGRRAPLRSPSGIGAGTSTSLAVQCYLSNEISSPINANNPNAYKRNALIHHHPNFTSRTLQHGYPHDLQSIRKKFHGMLFLLLVTSKILTFHGRKQSVEGAAEHWAGRHLFPVNATGADHSSQLPLWLTKPSSLPPTSPWAQCVGAT